MASKITVLTTYVIKALGGYWISNRFYKKDDSVLLTNNQAKYISSGNAIASTGATVTQTTTLTIADSIKSSRVIPDAQPKATTPSKGSTPSSGSGSSGSTPSTGSGGSTTTPVVTGASGSTATTDRLLAEDGTALLAEDGTGILIDDRVLRWVTPFSANENRANQIYNPKETPYTFQVSDSDMVVSGTSLAIKLYAPGAKIVNIWHSGKSQLSLTPDASNYVTGTLNLAGIPNGALWIEAHALQDTANEAISSNAIYAGIHLMLQGGSAAATTLPAKAQGLSLFFSDEFTGPLSSSRANSAPAGVKWFSSQPLGPEGYGDALFAPDAESGSLTPYKVINGQLRMRCTYNPTGAATLSAYDPFNRKWIGACLSTSFPDSTTNNGAIGNGYYEVRMLCPLGVGTWPAFWLNDQSVLVARKTLGDQGTNGREIDIVEQYNLTDGYVSTQHRYTYSNASNTVDNPTAFYNLGADQGKMGWAYHCFGALVTDTSIEYYFDGQLVATDNNKFNSKAANPSLNHIILTHAMNGGWPVAVPPSGYYDLFVDYVRYYK